MGRAFSGAQSMALGRLYGVHYAGLPANCPLTPSLSSLTTVISRWPCCCAGLPPDCLSYTSFYHGFMGRYFSCFTCDSTREVCHQAYMKFVLVRN